MFNLEQAISDWRYDMTLAGLASCEVLDELESHLREDVEYKIRSGLNTEKAFHEAAQKLGRAAVLKPEFDRVGNNERTFMKRSLMFIIAFVGIMVGMALVMPAVAQYRHEGVMRNDEPWLFLIGSLLTLAGCGAAFRGFRKSRA
jgi:hypothetical protein